MAIRRKKITAPRPSIEYTAQEAARDARRLAESMSLSKAPFDVESLATAIGIRVLHQPMDSSLSGFLKKSPDGWVIGVNALHHPRRQRFTIAHELGHYFLHRHKGEFTDEAMFRSDAASSPDEWDANRFASMVLMPAELVGPLLARGASIEELANNFGVSNIAASFRLKNMQEERIAI